MKAAVIGLGRAGIHHIEGYRVAGAEIAAVCDFNFELCRRVADSEDIPLATISAEEAIDTADIVSVATYDSAHAGQILQALDAGKHVMAEKPICTSYRQLLEITRRLQKYPYLSSNMPLRHTHPFNALRDDVEGGTLGEIYHVEASYLYGRLNKLRRGWRANEGGYSVFLGGGVHMVDLVMWLTGLRLSLISAAGSNFNAPEIDNNDTVTALFRLSNGGTATITANFGCENMPHQHEVKLLGTRNSIVSLNVGPSNKSKCIEEFAGAIIAGTRPPIDGDDIIEVTKVCLDVDEKARTRK